MNSRGCLLVVLAALLALLFWGGLFYFWAATANAHTPCRQTAREDYNPTGWEGCARYGEGRASRWQGPGVARNDCLWPWSACTPITITALTTGRSITATPTMFCDCWYGTPQEKLVDLDPAAVAALGLAWEDGVYPVRVEPANSLPDTALEPEHP